MGISIDKEIQSSKEYKILKNQILENYVQSIVNQLIKSPFIKKKKVYKYKVTLIDDDKTINAFCTPGGFIYVYTGLLKFLENEASLAAVLSHEIAHAEKRHVRQRMLSAMSIQIILSILFKDSTIFQDIAVNLGGTLALLANSRSDEMEADEYGFQYLKSTPYYQGAMSYFFDKMLQAQKNTQRSKTLEKILSTHPIPEDRLKANELRISKNKIPEATPSNLLSSRYQSTIQTHLGKTEDIDLLDDITE
jgi:predicted Zn-dependent protease